MSSSLTVHSNNEPFLDWIMTCNKKWILLGQQQWPAQWLDQEEAPKHFQKPNLYQKSSWSLVVCCWLDPLQLSELWWNHYIWEICSADRWDATKIATPAARIDQQKGSSSSPQQHLTAHYTTNASKVGWIGLQSFASSAILTWPLTNHHFKHLKNFLQGKYFLNQQEAENAFQEFLESLSTDFYTTGINKLISHWQNMLIVMVSILTSKDVSEPSYNVLKFSVWNHNYFCTAPPSIFLTFFLPPVTLSQSVLF